MRPAIRLLTLSLPLIAMIACATGADIPEDGSALEAQVGTDAGRPTGSIRPEAGAPTTTTTTSSDDAGKSATDAASAATDAASQPDTAPPVSTTPTPAVCDATNPKYGVAVIALVLSGSPPPACSGGACGIGDCCYNGKYCMPE